MSEFWFNKKSCRDFQTHIKKTEIFKSAERDYEFVEVPGSNGSLIIDNKRYKNVDINYGCFIADAFACNFLSIRNYLAAQTGYQRLEDSICPDYFRMGVFQDRWIRMW